MAKAYGIIYRITNKLNGLQYIGQTTGTCKITGNIKSFLLKDSLEFGFQSKYVSEAARNIREHYKNYIWKWA